MRGYLIFLGDYADRGPKGVEVIDSVEELIGKYPGRLIALRGNHEDYTEGGSREFHLHPSYRCGFFTRMHVH